MDEPKDLGVKIGTPEEAFWTTVKKTCEDLIDRSKHEIIIQTHVRDLADSKIKEEKK